jgi:NADH-quinone oxidoreductase subunit M
MQKIFYGPAVPTYTLTDLSIREKLIMVPLVIAIIWLGVFPQPVLDTTGPLVKTILDSKEFEAKSKPAWLWPQGENLSSKGGPHE